jgi:hypothetical protein
VVAESSFAKLAIGHDADPAHCYKEKNLREHNEIVDLIGI